MSEFAAIFVAALLAVVLPDVIFCYISLSSSSTFYKVDSSSSVGCQKDEPAR